MRKVLILFLVIVLALFMSSSVALASGYLGDSTIQAMTGSSRPHGGYADTTNKCKACHAVHLATGSYRILRASTSSTECDYCHKSSTGIITTVSRVDGSTTEGHTMGYSGDAPDDTDTAWSTTSFKCADCHSVHNVGTVTLSGKSSSDLLKKNPDSSGSDFTSSTKETEWCADCHAANRGLYSTGKTVGGSTKYGHDCDDAGMSTGGDGYATVSPDSTNDGPTCKQCHQAGSYPHDASGSSKDLLKDAYGGTYLDDVCNDCHNTASLP